jgi:hypothetical protein
VTGIADQPGEVAGEALDRRGWGGEAGVAEQLDEGGVVARDDRGGAGGGLGGSEAKALAQRGQGGGHGPPVEGHQFVVADESQQADALPHRAGGEDGPYRVQR